MPGYERNTELLHGALEIDRASDGSVSRVKFERGGEMPEHNYPYNEGRRALHTDVQPPYNSDVFVPPSRFDGATGRGKGATLDVVLTQSIANGSYVGGNANVSVDLRVDLAEFGIISGDFYGIRFGRRDYLASFRTVSAAQAETCGCMRPAGAFFEDRDGHKSTGNIDIRPGNAEGSVLVTAFVDGDVQGLPTRQNFDVLAEWQSTNLRELSVELEMEQGTSPPPSYRVSADEEVTIGSAFRKAGFELRSAGQTTVIPKPSAGWGTQQLHALMKAIADSELSKPEWRQQLLWLGNPARRGLLGIMFDSTAMLPRQGTAVFDGEIRDFFPNDPDRKVIQTAVHEIGHALNLAHRFEREVGRGDSLSFMNYPWRYRGGNREQEFWQNFAFQFDRDELEFLRHGPRNKVIPGGAAFHSVNYWADGSGGYSPYLPEAPLDTIALHLEAPLDGPMFEFGQPVLLKVSLTNTSQEAISFNKRLLDPKGSFLEVLIRRVQQGATRSSDAMHFHPIVERCFDVVNADIVEIPPGASFSDNINVTFGASGFSFAEPGAYDIQVIGTVIVTPQGNSPSDAIELIAPSNKLRIHVAHPQSLQEEAEAVSVLLRDDVGTYFALGGSGALPQAQDDLEEIYARRMRGRKTVSDPIAANIIRCKAIEMGRWSLRKDNSHFVEVDGDPESAVALLESLKEGRNAGLRTFDSETGKGTMNLLKRLKKRAQGKK